MKSNRILSVLAAVVLFITVLGYALHVAYADNSDRAIPSIAATSPSPGTIRVEWGTPSDTDSLSSYRVSWGLWENGHTSYKDPNTDTGGNAYPDAPASSYTITGLADGDYIVAVRARYDDNRNGGFKESDKVVVGGSASDEDATPTPEPTTEPTTEPTPAPTPEATLPLGAITGLTLTSSRPGHLWVSWDEADPAPTEYRLNWAPVDQSFPSWDSPDGGNHWYSGTQIDFSNLVDRDVTYKLQMRAIYRTGPNSPWSGPWSDVVTQRVRDNPPGPSTDLSVDSATHDGVVLSWSAPSHTGLTGYRVLRGSDADSLEIIVDDSGTPATGYTDTTAAGDTTYHYAVMALSLDGDGSQSGTVSATTPPRTPDTPVIAGAPAAPTGLTARLDGSGGVTLTWTDPDDDAITGYRVLRGADALSMRIILEDTGSTSVSYTDASPAENRTHVYAVQARNAAGLSQLSNTPSVATLGAPTNLLLAASAGSGVTLNWTGPDSSAVTGYRIRRGPTADALAVLVANTGGMATAYMDGTVAPDTTYHYAVNALGTAGSGPRSALASVTVPPSPQTNVPRDDVVNIDEEPLIAEQQQEQAEPCADPRIESVGGSATNGGALWVWRSVARDPNVDPQGCWYNFRLSYSDDYGATFTEVAVVRGAVGTTDNETYTINGTTYQRNGERHGAAVPELSIVSALRVSVGCDSEGENCAHTLDSTDASLDQYYYSRHEDRTKGADTKALLVPANSSEGGNAFVTGWLEYDDTETHTYRIAMTAGKTYVFDEHYRKWAMMSGEWREGEHFYLPDEFRISLYTKNSAGQLVPVGDFQNQPELGWQTLHGDPDHQRYPSSFVSSSAQELFSTLDQVKTVLDFAHVFPPGSQHRNACVVSEVVDYCGLGLDIHKDDGRQLRTASYVPTKSGIYYLVVTRVADDWPQYRTTVSGEKWVVEFAEDTGTGNTELQPVYGGIAAGSAGLRSALPYYEISVEARGPTLSEFSISLVGDIYLESTDNNSLGFLPGRFHYRVGLPSDIATITIAATAAHSDATVAISPSDANSSTAGHQINAPAGAVTNVTITVTRGSDQETYTFEMSRP